VSQTSAPEIRCYSFSSHGKKCSRIVSYLYKKLICKSNIYIYIYIYIYILMYKLVYELISCSSLSSKFIKVRERFQPMNNPQKSMNILYNYYLIRKFIHRQYEDVFFHILYLQENFPRTPVSFSFFIVLIKNKTWTALSRVIETA